MPKLIESIIIDRLKDEKENIVKQWNNEDSGSTTSYFFLDDLLPEDLAYEIYEAFPKNDDNFIKKKSFREQKRTLTNLAEAQTILGDVTRVFQAPSIIELISEYVGMANLSSDPSLYAGGLSMMFNGDFLNPHIDNSHDADRKKYRRLNLLFYITPDWKLENGGNFELWDSKVHYPVTIHSRFNRLVVMETNDTSWHSVSPVLSDQTRCCVSNYYFSDNSPSGFDYFHVTSFTGRPKEKIKRLWGVVDNFSRNTLSKFLKFGRGKKLINPQSRKE